MKIFLAKMVHNHLKMINQKYFHLNKLQIFQWETIQKIKQVKETKICQTKRIFWADQNRQLKEFHC